jgi:hypothetical protein
MKHIFTDNERIEISEVGGVPFIITGRNYLVRASGDFGGGTLIVGFVEDGNYQSLTTLEAGGGFGIEAPINTLFAEISGATSPNVIFGIVATRGN